MTKEEAKQLKYIETQRDAAKAEALAAKGIIREQQGVIETLSEELAASLKGESATLDALKAENAALVGRQLEVAIKIDQATTQCDRLKEDLTTAQTKVAMRDEELARVHAKLSALEADTEGKDKLKKRLVAKSEELRLALLDTAKAKQAKIDLEILITSPKTLQNTVLALTKSFGTAAIMNVLLSAGEIKKIDQPAVPSP